MSYKSWPYVSQATTDLEYSKLFRAFQLSGVDGSPSDTALKGYSPNALMVTKLPVGAALVRGFFFEVTAEETMTHGVATSQPRVDRVVLRLDFNQALSSRVRPLVLGGTPAAANPSPPALTREANGIWEVPLYRVNIGAGITAIDPSAVIPEREFLGRPPTTWTTDTRPSAPLKNQLGMNDSLGYWEYWSGTTWEKAVKGVVWGDIGNKPTTSTLDGRNIFVQPTAPSAPNAGDLWIEG